MSQQITGNTENEWNQRNELKLPLGPSVNIERLDLDLDSPRLKGALKNLGFKLADMKCKTLEQL